MTGDTWVFGYGSLVSPASVAHTIGRTVDRRHGFATAQLAGYGRRWNYGSLRQRGDWHGPNGWVEAGVVVCLGLVVARDEGCNGAVVRVTDDELGLLDRRESDYDRIDVTDLVTIEHDVIARRIVTYVPRPAAIERCRRASEAGRAAVERRYHRLVEDAFRALGTQALDAYATLTPAPEVPIVEFARRRRSVG